MKKRERFYKSFEDDFSFTKNQDFDLPQGYRYIRNKPYERLFSVILYAIALFLSFFYLRFFLHIKIKGKEKLKQANGGIFLYANHTQPVGDVFLPAFAVFPRRIYTLASRANLALPVIGKLLPFLGALPLGDDFRSAANLNRAIKERYGEKNCIVIYPEAHVWEYYTKIRPFYEDAFSFPARLSSPVYSMTLVYKKRRFLKKPRGVAYIDGPFLPDGESFNEKRSSIYLSVLSSMEKRASESDCEYIIYREAD